MNGTGTHAHGSQALRRARRIADETLFPAALAVDRADRVPEGHLDLLADNGFYGLAAPEELTTLELPDFPSVLRLVEILAGACLTTTFVWVQHHGAMIAAGKTDNDALRERYLADLAAGTRRAGMAVGAAVKTGAPMVRAEPVNDGYVFDGVCPWVTGWGMIDTLYAAGRDHNDRLVFALLDAVSSDTLIVEPLDMLAVQASRTVTVRFTRHHVPHERVTATMPHALHLEGDAESLRFVGALALGVTARAIALLDGDAGTLPDDLDATRARLLEATHAQVPAARAAGSELALRAAAACAVHHGSRSVLLGAHAQRLIREAAFLLVFGSRPRIRTALLHGLTHRPSSA